MSKTKEELDALKEEINKVNEKICELTPEELEQVNGGVTVPVKGEDIVKTNTTEALQGKPVGVVVIASEGQPGSEMRFGVR